MADTRIYKLLKAVVVYAAFVAAIITSSWVFYG